MAIEIRGIVAKREVRMTFDSSHIEVSSNGTKVSQMCLDLPVLHLPRQAYRLHVYLGIDIMCRWCLPCVSAGDAPRQPDRGPRGLLHLLVVLCHHPVASVEVSGSETFGVMDVSNLRIWPKGSARKCIR
jgi:hypothetical protein